MCDGVSDVRYANPNERDLPCGTVSSPPVGNADDMAARRSEGIHVRIRGVKRLMRNASVECVYRLRKRWTTGRDPRADLSDDLVNRQFYLDRPTHTGLVTSRNNRRRRTRSTWRR